MHECQAIRVPQRWFVAMRRMLTPQGLTAPFFRYGCCPMLPHDRLLVVLLRLFGGITCLALLATLLPTQWMAAAHAWLGLGPFPRAPLTEYLTRSIAGLYA